ncbi:hypothetical protein BH11PLA2_BH11PLA2_40810 [soil metagenome]
MALHYGCLVAALFAFSFPNARADYKPIRIGIIGLDTSHVPAFTALFNDPKAEGDLAGFKVVVAFHGGSKDITASHTRVAEYTQQLKEKYNFEIVNSIDDLLTKVDVVMLESVDGRPHLGQAVPVLTDPKLGIAFAGRPKNMTNYAFRLHRSQSLVHPWPGLRHRLAGICDNLADISR